MVPNTTLDNKDLQFDRILLKQLFEENLWAAADQMRSSTQLKSSEYTALLLGLFFLSYVSNHFDAWWAMS